MGYGERIHRRSRIPKPNSPTVDVSPVRFSFSQLDLVHPKFAIDFKNHEFVNQLFVELKRLSSGTVGDLCSWAPQQHSHAITFSDTSEPDGFLNLSEQLEPEIAWQFAIRPDRPWRVHGFFTESVFYVVWFDPEHKLDRRWGMPKSISRTTGIINAPTPEIDHKRPG